MQGEFDFPRQNCSPSHTYSSQTYNGSVFATYVICEVTVLGVGMYFPTTEKLLDISLVNKSRNIPLHNKNLLHSGGYFISWS